MTLTAHEKADVDMYLLPTYDVLLNEPPHLMGDVIETLASINEFIDRAVFPAMTRLLPAKS